MAGLMRIADGAQHQPGMGARQNHMHGNDDDDAGVDEQILSEKDWSYNG